MQFTTRKDVEAPQAFAFVAASDFSVFERQALRRNVEILQSGAAQADGTGRGWRIRFDYRGRPRTIDARVTAFDPSSGYRIRGTTDGMDLELAVELMPLSKTATRIFLTLDLLPRSFRARLLMQSLRLMRRSIVRNLDRRAATFARDIEDRFRAAS